RPSNTASACMGVNGRRNRRVLRATVSCPSGVLRSSAASAMNLPESPPRRYHGKAKSRRFPRPRGPDPANPRKETGGPKAALLQIPDWKAQFAALAGGLSVLLVGGLVLAVALMPWSRSAAVFSALSSLASGGT